MNHWTIYLSSLYINSNSSQKYSGAVEQYEPAASIGLWLAPTYLLTLVGITNCFLLTRILPEFSRQTSFVHWLGRYLLNRLARLLASCCVHEVLKIISYLSIAIDRIYFSVCVCVSGGGGRGRSASWLSRNVGNKFFDVNQDMRTLLPPLLLLAHRRHCHAMSHSIQWLVRHFMASSIR